MRPGPRLYVGYPSAYAPPPGGGGPAPSGGYADAVLADNPVAYYRLGDLHDLMGGPDGVITGAVTPVASLLPSGEGDGLEFPDASAYLTVPDSPPLRIGAGDWTVEYWVKLIASSAEFGYVVGTPHCFGMVGSNATANYLEWGGGEGPLVHYPGPPGVWYGDPPRHVVLVAKGTDAQFVVDGVPGPVADASATKGSTNAADGFQINHDSLGRGAQMRMQEVAIYNKALTPAQIAAHYAAAQT